MREDERQELTYARIRKDLLITQVGSVKNAYMIFMIIFGLISFVTLVFPFHLGIVEWIVGYIPFICLVLASIIHTSVLKHQINNNYFYVVEDECTRIEKDAVNFFKFFIFRFRGDSPLQDIFCFKKYGEYAGQRTLYNYSKVGDNMLLVIKAGNKKKYFVHTTPSNISGQIDNVAETVRRGRPLQD